MQIKTLVTVFTLISLQVFGQKSMLDFSLGFSNTKYSSGSEFDKISNSKANNLSPLNFAINYRQQVNSYFYLTTEIGYTSAEDNLDITYSATNPILTSELHTIFQNDKIYMSMLTEFRHPKFDWVYANFGPLFGKDVVKEFRSSYKILGGRKEYVDNLVVDHNDAVGFVINLGISPTIGKIGLLLNVGYVDNSSLYTILPYTYMHTSHFTYRFGISYLINDSPLKRSED
jgi:hypothetical protein